VLDAHANEAFGDGDGVLRDELLEGDKEAGLDGDAAGDGGAPVGVSTISLECRIRTIRTEGRSWR
jgi:hypothetical protein